MGQVFPCIFFSLPIPTENCSSSSKIFFSVCWLIIVSQAAHIAFNIYFLLDISNDLGIIVTFAINYSKTCSAKSYINKIANLNITGKLWAQVIHWSSWAPIEQLHLQHTSSELVKETQDSQEHYLIEAATIFLNSIQAVPSY